ncbi:MAG: exodeoxyribonuclease III [bacterium]|nr:exodeoxyribonuclease III [bacterium]
MKIISWNVNGIRACSRKGFLNYLKEEDPDIACIQETKANPEDLEEEILTPSGYNSIWHSAEKKGYSGVAVFTKIKPKLVLEGLGIQQYDSEGRVIIAEYDDFTLLNIYFPNGQKNEERLQYKLDFYSDLFEYCNDLRAQGRNLIICGDYNTAHKEIDLANPQQNKNYSGFLKVEREWIDRIVSWGYVDTFRCFNTLPEQYTWWTYRVGARRRNIGWRIDYFFVNSEFLKRVESAFIRNEVTGSDHCPTGIILR